MNKEYSTILVLILALIVLYIFSGSFIVLYIALALGLLCLLSPWVTAKFHFIWMKLAVAMGSVTAVIILTIVFFVVVVPLSFIARIAGKKFILSERSGSTYFKQRNFLYNKESVENVW